jgi:hypothetical protein
MESLIKGKTTVNIGKSMEKHKDINDIHPVNALSSCDTMVFCYMYGVKKRIAVKVLRAGSDILVLLRVVDTPMDRSPKRSMHSCHHDMNTVQVNRSLKQCLGCGPFETGCTSSSLPPKLSGLIPTNKAFAENVQIAHY